MACPATGGERQSGRDTGGQPGSKAAIRKQAGEIRRRRRRQWRGRRTAAQIMWASVCIAAAANDASSPYPPSGPISETSACPTAVLSVVRPTTARHRPSAADHGGATPSLQRPC